jgi:hypothetical protein
MCEASLVLHRGRRHGHLGHSRIGVALFNIIETPEWLLQVIVVPVRQNTFNISPADAEFCGWHACYRWVPVLLLKPKRPSKRRRKN